MKLNSKIMPIVAFSSLCAFTFSGCTGEASEIETNYIDDSALTDMNLTEVTEPLVSSALIDDFELTLQTPELPTGCEITALTMLIDYYIPEVKKTTLASDFLPTVYDDFDTFSTNEKGQLIGPDLNNYFYGDPFTSSGYVCGTGAIMTAANDFLDYENSTYEAVEITGVSAEDIYSYVANGIPVMVWDTIDMQDRSATQGWYTEDGEYVEWSASDHAGVLIGYDNDNGTVTVADPLAGIVEYDMEQFESVFAERGNKCIIIE